MAVEGLCKQLDLVEEQWRDRVPDSAPIIDWGNWEHCLRSHLEEMQRINNIQDIREAAVAYDEREVHWNNDVMTASTFINITETGMKTQFEAAIMQPYNDMIAGISTTSAPNLRYMRAPLIFTADSLGSC